MPQWVNLKSCNATAENIVALWHEAGAFEAVSSLLALDYPPHITLAMFPEDPGDISGILREVFSSQPKLTLMFDGIGSFDNDPLVLWAKPRADDALLSLHKSLHRHFDAALCQDYYRPEHWVPHCSLATKVLPASKATALAWAREQQFEFSVEFDVADLVIGPPLEVKHEIDLGAG